MKKTPTSDPHTAGGVSTPASRWAVAAAALANWAVPERARVEAGQAARVEVGRRVAQRQTQEVLVSSVALQDTLAARKRRTPTTPM
jgi:hypothetical protein